jgi:thioredoxin
LNEICYREYDSGYIVFKGMKGNFNDIINSDKPVLVDFYADWCQPCKIQSPILQEVARDLNEKVKVIKIDVDKNQDISWRYQVQSIPTIILFKNGTVKWRQVGVTPKQQIVNAVIQNS